MTTYRIIVTGRDETFTHDFDGEPQINLTFEAHGSVFKVVTRAHDEDAPEPTLHAEVI